MRRLPRRAFFAEAMKSAGDTEITTTARIITVRVIYLARLREALGRASETLAFGSEVAPSMSDLMTVLRARGGAWAHELGVGKAVRFAVNQRLARADTPIAEGDEVAVFPPVTGG